MPVPDSYPGVYIREVPSGVRTITGVSTSIALFIGMTRRGRLEKPKRVLSFADYERSFGTDAVPGEMTDQVRQFFLNSGQQAWITRIADGAQEASVHLLNARRNGPVLTVTAKDAGLDGNQIRVEVDYGTPSLESTFNLTVFREVVNAAGELEIEGRPEGFPNLSMNPKDGRFVENIVNQQSTLVDVKRVVDEGSIPPFKGYSLSGILIREEADGKPDEIRAIDGPMKTITVADNRQSAYPKGVAITVSGSAVDGNNATFKVTNTSFNGTDTVISTDGNLTTEGPVGATVIAATAASDINGIINAGNNTIRMKVDDGAFRTIVLPPLAPVVAPIDFTAWQNVLTVAFPGPGVTVSLTDPFPGGAPGFRFLKFQSNTDGGSVVIQKSLTNDLAVPLQLGVDQGGLEVDGRANQRPAPTGFFADLGDLAAATGPVALASFANAEQAAVAAWTLKDASGRAYSGVAQPIAFTGATGTRMYNGTAFTNVTIALVGSLRNVQQNLAFLGRQIRGEGEVKGTDGAWTAALQGHRLVLKPTFGDVDSDTTASLTSGPTYNIGADAELFDSTPGPSVQANVKAYRLGGPGTGGYQDSGDSGEDGFFPKPADYLAIFPAIDREVDLFNLMILPRAVDQPDTIRQSVWSPASIFCQQRRAFLLIDPLSDNEEWSDVNEVTARPTGGVNDLRAGLVNDHAAIYWPRLLVSANGATKPIDPSGSIAGLMARTDANRGVWKAPAGLEATIRGVRGVQHMMSDPENGIINPEAVNAIRVFPNGIVSWGARTMAGFNDSDYKYIPVRRLALFIEESLYRGLKFAVFEPNDEPLWAQIRLAAGAFMNNLFRQGAFQGQKASDAYFVKVDSETTTQNDINLGIVNVVIGFAPLKPAEFVIITIQQMAGQVQT